MLAKSQKQKFTSHLSIAKAYKHKVTKPLWFQQKTKVKTPKKNDVITNNQTDRSKFYE